MTEATMTTRRKTALAIVDAYNAWDIERIMALRTDDCMMIIRPASTGVEPMNNATYRNFFMAIMPNISNFTVTIKSIVEDPVANKIVLWAESTADTAAGKGTYGNEYMLTFEFNEEGDKTKNIYEFVDSQKSKEQRAVFGR